MTRYPHLRSRGPRPRTGAWMFLLPLLWSCSGRAAAGPGPELPAHRIAPPTTRGAAPDSAEAAAAAFFAALEQERWLDAARLVDPAFVERYHREQLRWLTGPQPEFPTEAEMIEQMLRHDPEMPRAVAEYQAKQVVESRDHREFVSDVLAGLDSVEQLDRLSPLELMARHLEASDSRYQMRRALERAGPRIPDSVRAQLAELPTAISRRAVIGLVAEGDSLVHVVYHLEEGVGHGPYPEFRALLPMRLTGEGWRVANPETGLWGSTSSGIWIEHADTAPPR